MMRVPYGFDKPGITRPWRKIPLFTDGARLPSYILPVIPAAVTSFTMCPPVYSLAATVPFIPSASLGLASGSSPPSPVWFYQCKVRPSRLKRRLEVHFLQILPPSESNWQEKPPPEAVRMAMSRIIKLQNGSGRKGPMKGKNKHSITTIKP